MKLDMHIHTSYSPDGMVSPKDVLKIAKKKGLDMVAITDHNEIKGALKAKKLGILPVLVGIEISTASGHILAYDVDCLIPRDMSVEETVEKIHECGGFAVIAHPYRFWSGIGEEEALKNMQRVDGIEIFNGRCKAKSNRKAKKLWEAHAEKVKTAGSDAHYPDEIGKAGIFVDCEDDIMRCLRSGEPFGTSRNMRETLRYVKKAISEWSFRGFKKI